MSTTATTIAAGVMEVGKVLLTGYFSYMRQQGASAEDAQKLYDEAKADFDKNNPASLPDVEE